eukprot:PhF_6_TR26360/c0_g2_i1/m.37971
MSYDPQETVVRLSNTTSEQNEDLHRDHHNHIRADNKQQQKHSTPTRFRSQQQQQQQKGGGSRQGTPTNTSSRGVRVWRYSTTVESARTKTGGYPESNVGYIPKRTTTPPRTHQQQQQPRASYLDPTEASFRREQENFKTRAGTQSNKSPSRQLRERMWSFSNHPEFVYLGGGTNVQVGTPKAVVVSMFAGPTASAANMRDQKSAYYFTPEDAPSHFINPSPPRTLRPL